MLDCCEPLAKIKAEGITFGKVACLAHCNGAKVEAFRTSERTIDDFRKHIISCSSSEDCHVITSYHRGVFKQVLWAYPYYCLITNFSSFMLCSLFLGILLKKKKNPMSKSKNDLCPWIIVICVCQKVKC
jgi:hypothetical protein